MSFSLSDLSTGNEFLDDTFSNVASKFISDTLSRNNLIVSAPAPRGNQNAVQLQAGQTGQAPQGSSANNFGVLNSLGLGGFSSDKTMLYVAIGGIVLIGAFFLLKK